MSTDWEAEILTGGESQGQDHRVGKPHRMALAPLPLHSEKQRHLLVEEIITWLLLSENSRAVLAGFVGPEAICTSY